MNLAVTEINKSRYLKLTEYFKTHRTSRKVLAISYKLLPILIFIAYPLLLIFSFIFVREEFLQLLLVPACVFIFVSALRVLIDEERPYERYGVPSVFYKQTKGKSMPSRHTASAFIISLAFLKAVPLLGAVLLIISCAIAVSRVLSGVHYIRDVAVGAVISIIIGAVFLFII